ncbi:class I SAM-dependent RNA methyltransferase [Roseovarius sp. SCSIO 43702]|uniref:THUMP domain-containing class I SAM-dependent RNA methyltransferase n=1 Tax=Roseovarius sp. SCSIO 43702 TaxID=2823043 RepID=UPI001C72B9C7|nr:class I SAM-dependent RNA methyltransferase [Roseovarius sp. SCSIO 43702]QYX55799.1 class I SAM-dependent RNA methyltransferase [Roseovarius sp. SCSIO 43702]
MAAPDPTGIFLTAPPGLEGPLADEARAAGFAEVKSHPGGVAVAGGWPEVWRANLSLRGASRVLARIGEFRAMHVAQLDKRARKFPWSDHLRPDIPVRVEAACKRSRIYHDRAAAQRVARAITEELGAPVTADAALRVMLRIEDDLCTLSLDTSGEPLHRRGFKQYVGKAAMRETMAALFLRQCGYDGTEPVLDPMCGSGTFLLEAAEMATGRAPGRARRFAFEDLASFDAEGWTALREATVPRTTALTFHGRDRDAGAIKGARENALRAGVADHCTFAQGAISDLTRPEGPPGLVIVNPPYGGRVGNKKMIYGLYAALGRVLLDGFSGWRVGLVTTEGGLARATALPFAPPGPPVAHGGLKVRLWQTGPLP